MNHEQSFYQPKNTFLRKGLALAVAINMAISGWGFFIRKNTDSQIPTPPTSTDTINPGGLEPIVVRPLPPPPGAEPTPSPSTQTHEI